MDLVIGCIKKQQSTIEYAIINTWLIKLVGHSASTLQVG